MGPGNMFLAQSKGWYNIIFRWHMYNPPLFNKRTMAIFKPPLRCRISHPNSLSLQVQLWRPNFPERPFFRPWPNWSIKKNDLGFVLQDSRHQISGSINSQHLKTRCCTTTQGFLVADGNVQGAARVLRFRCLTEGGVNIFSKFPKHHFSDLLVDGEKFHKFVEGVCDVFWSRRIVRNTDGESCILYHHQTIIKMSNNVFPAHCLQTKWFAK